MKNQKNQLFTIINLNQKNFRKKKLLLLIKKTLKKPKSLMLFQGWTGICMPINFFLGLLKNKF